ncbi:MAG: DinB family protein [Chloroflexi bacterium]|nr:DinB family protein [Chloroflexota bacterium]
MDSIAVIKEALAGARRLLGDVMADVTPEMAHWTPPGVANSIATSYAHCMSSEDSFVQRVIQGRPTVWEQGKWGEKLGMPASIAEAFDWTKPRQLDLPKFREYTEEVAASTATLLTSLTPEDLNRTVTTRRGERTLASLLTATANHLCAHAGEISALKGCQGGRGYAV